MAETIDLEAVKTKLAAARTRLILDKPFLGALTLRLPMKAAKNWCTTTATDTKTFYYNPEYIDNLSLDETQFMLSHEALHCALSHFARRNHRNKMRWDLACDYAINYLLIEDGLKSPPNSLIMPAYDGMIAEEIYPMIAEDDDRETLDQHIYDQDTNEGGSSGGKPPPDRQPKDNANTQQSQKSPDNPDKQGSGAPNQSADIDEAGADMPESLTPDEMETLSIQWQQRLSGAAQQAMQAGKLSGGLAQIIEHLLQPQLPWRTLLAHYMSNTARDDYSYMRPSRREGQAIFPSLKSNQANIVIALDISGSIHPQEITEFLSEVNALKSQIRARVTLLPCDANLVEGAPWIYETWDEFILPEKMKGGGGTSFQPVFNWVNGMDQAPEILIYFTDGQAKFPQQAPNYPVIWLIKGKVMPPWGQKIQLN